MKTRPMRIEDIQELKELHLESGFDYAFPDLLSEKIEDVTVVTEDDGSIVAAGVAKNIVELVLVMSKRGHPMVKLRRIALLHKAMCENLKLKGFTEGIAFMSPALAKSYGPI